MAKGKTTERSQPKKKTSKHKRKRDIRPLQTRQPVKQDAQRRIGQDSSAAEPLIKKYISRAWQVLTLNYWPT